MTEPAAPSTSSWAGRGLPAACAAGAAAALLLPWWRADGGPVLLGAGPVTGLPPDAWTGLEVAGAWAVVVAVSTGAAVLLALVTCVAPRSAVVARGAAAAAGAGAAVGAVRALVAWGPSGAPGVWVALVAGIAAVGCAVASSGRESPVPARRSGTASRAFRHDRGVVAAAVVVVAVAGVAGPSGPRPPGRGGVGPFVPVAGVGAFPLRSGEIGLAATDDAQPVLAGGVPGVTSRAGVVVATGDGRARVLARLDRGAPAPIGVVGNRVVHWISADSVAVTELRVGSDLDVVVRGVAEAGPLGSDGSVWLRTDADPTGTVRRLDVARLVGEQRIAATYLPVVTVQEPEPPVDVRTVLPVRGGGLRALAQPGRLELLTGTAAGIATTPLAGSRCGPAGVADLDRAAGDRSGVWFVLAGADGERLARLDPGSDGAIRTIAAVLPGIVTALTAPGDGSLLFVARDPLGSVLWRLPDAAAALGTADGPPVTCPPVA